MTQSPAKSTCPHWVPIWVWPLKRNSERSAAEQLQILTQQGRGPTIYTAITAITQYHAVAVPRETTQKLIWKNHKNQMQILAMICWTNLLGKSGQVHMKSSHSEWLSESWGNAEGITTGSTWTMPAPVPSPCRSQALRAAACHDMEWLRWSTCPIFNRKFISTCSIFNSLQQSSTFSICKNWKAQTFQHSSWRLHRGCLAKAFGLGKSSVSTTSFRSFGQGRFSEDGTMNS